MQRTPHGPARRRQPAHKTNQRTRRLHTTTAIPGTVVARASPIVTITGPHPDTDRQTTAKSNRGSLAAPPVVNFLCRPGGVQTAHGILEQRAPQKWCVQFWCSSKPGGVMVPPEPNELTSRLYSAPGPEARKKFASLGNSLGRGGARIPR